MYLTNCLTATGKGVKTKGCTSASSEQLWFLGENEQICSVANPDKLIHSSKKGKATMKKCKVYPSKHFTFLSNAFRGTIEARMSLKVLISVDSKVSMQEVADDFEDQQ